MEILFQREIRIPSSVVGLDQCLELVEEIKEHFHLDFDASFKLHTIIVESVENAFIHGNKGVRDLEVRVLIAVTQTEILIEVEDSGEGFELNHDANLSEVPEINCEGGRGIFFITRLSSEFYKLGKGNIICIKLKR